MRAYGFTRYGGPEVQQFLDLPEPVPGPGQLLVQVEAAGVNPFDVKVRSGAFSGGTALERPYTQGRELAGTVIAVGPEVTAFAPGDRVFANPAPGFGGFAEQALVSAAAAATIPEHVSFVDAAAFPVAAGTGAAGVKQLGLDAGRTLLINGASGGVGLASVQIARALGLHVVGTASVGKKGLVESVGAIHVTYGDGVADRVRLAAPMGIDGIWDLVGGDSLRAVGELAPRGAVVTSVDPQAAGEFGGHFVSHLPPAQVYPWIAELADEGKYDPQVGEVLPFDQAAEALALVASGKATGKVVLVLR